LPPFPLSGVWLRAEAATLFTDLEVFGLARSFEAFEATLLEVRSFLATGIPLLKKVYAKVRQKPLPQARLRLAVTSPAVIRTSPREPTLPIPSTRQVRWWTRELPTTLFLGVPPCLAAIATTAKAHSDAPGSWLWKLSAVSAVWLGLATGLKSLQAHFKDKELQKKQSPLDLSGCLHVMHQALAGMCIEALDKAVDDGCLRITVHKLDGESLEQLVPYVGGRGGEPGRTFSRRSGIIGQACLRNKSIIAKRQNDNYEAFVQEMIDVWNFPSAEARELDPSRFAWMAVPLTEGESNDDVIGVVYLDSRDRDLFTEEIQGLILYCVKGVAGFVRLRYGRS
jgi:hypothetical protein